MKILIVAMPESIHTARWINQIRDQGWDIRLFPSVDTDYIHPNLKGVKIYSPLFNKLVSKKEGLYNHGYYFLSTLF